MLMKIQRYRELSARCVLYFIITELTVTYKYLNLMRSTLRRQRLILCPQTHVNSLRLLWSGE
jgi:hypothetical protein